MLKEDIIDYSIEDYYYAIEEYLKLLKKSPDLIGIYQIGSIKNPGVSDIDLVIVLKDKPLEFSYSRYSLSNLSSKSKYLFMHEPFVINYSNLGGIHQLFPINNIKEIYWNNLFIRPKLETPDPKKVFEYFFISYLLRGYYDKKKITSLRLFLTVASLSRYSLNILSLTQGKSNRDLSKLSKKFNYFKKNYKKINKEDLKNLLRDYSYFNLELSARYIQSLLKKSRKTYLPSIDLCFFPRIIVYFPMKYSFKLSKIIIFPNIVKEQFNNYEFSQIRNRLYNYNSWVYKNRLNRFSIFTLQFSKIYFRFLEKFN